VAGTGSVDGAGGNGEGNEGRGEDGAGGNGSVEEEIESGQEYPENAAGEDRGVYSDAPEDDEEDLGEDFDEEEGEDPEGEAEGGMLLEDKNGMSN